MLTKTKAPLWGWGPVAVTVCNIGDFRFELKGFLVHASTETLAGSESLSCSESIIIKKIRNHGKINWKIPLRSKSLQ